MTTFSLKRTDFSDATGIAKIIDQGETPFNRCDVINLVEKSILSITAVDNGAVVGFIALYDAPDVAGVLPAAWQAWLHASFNAPHVTPFNTLFVRMLATRDNASAEIAHQLLKSAFTAAPDVAQLVAVLPTSNAGSLAATGWAHHLDTTIDKTNSEVAYDALQVSASAVHPRLKIRAARVEDFDDLVPIFNKQSDVLNKYFGEFFLNDIIEAQNASNRSFVVDDHGKARGFISVSTEVDLAVLNQCFELSVFDHLKSVRKIARTMIPDPTLASASGLHDESAVSVADGDAEKDVKRKSSSVAKAPRTSKATRSGSLTLRSSQAKMSVSGVASRSSKTNVLSEIAEDVEAAPKEPVIEYIDEWYDSALCICLFCVDEQLETRAVDLVQAVFSVFSDKDYCILTIPHTAQELPLLQNFTRVSPLSRNILHQELYVMHRFSLIEDINVRKMAASDHAVVEDLYKGMDTAPFIAADIQRALASGSDSDGTKVFALVVHCVDQVVGVVVARSVQDAGYLRSQYCIEDFVLFGQHSPDEHLYLNHFILNPLFQRHNKFVLRETMRLLRKSCVYYRVLHPGETAPSIAPSTLTSVIDDMLPVRRRRQIKYSMDVLKGNAPSARLRDDSTPFALLLLSRKLMLEPKVTVNARVVVVGASDTGISCLESLLFRSHLRFNNVTLVSPDGMPLHAEPAHGQALSTSLAYSPKDLKKIALRTWVNVVAEKMVDIDRKEQTLILSDGAVVPYDFLVLAPGLQYRVVLPAGISGAPRNVIAVNTAADVGNLLDWIDSSFLHEDGNAVLYGSSLDTLSLIQTMINIGVPGSRVVLVKPTSEAFVSDAVVDAYIHKQLSQAGVVVHEGLGVTGWAVREGSDDEVGVAYLKAADGSSVQVPCDLFVYADARRVDPQAFKAVNSSSLVFDGRLVVDNHFQTNDPLIFAGGPFTKLARRYMVSDDFMARCSSKEAGQRLADALLDVVDPLASPLRLEPLQVAEFQRARLVRSLLPGNIVFFQSTSPARVVSRKIPEGRTLLTQSSNEENFKYFNIHLNGLGFVDHVTVASEASIQDLGNYSCLHGLNEKYLNNLVARYDEGLIADFFAYLREAWATAVFHDRFATLIADLARSVRENPSVDLVAFNATVTKLAATDIDVKTAEALKSVRAHIELAPTVTLVRDRLMEYLAFNAYQLPMYARPNVW